MQYTIYEHQYIRDKKLVSLIQKEKELHHYFEIGFDYVRATSFCGSINIEEHEILILPKISKRKEVNQTIFFYMLLYSYDIPNLENYNSDTNFLPLLIDIFSKKLLEKLHQTGIYKDYHLTRNRGNYIKGKLVINDYIRYRGRKGFLCEYDEFGINNPLNQFFSYAVRKFQSLSYIHSNIARLVNIFDEVEPKYFENIKFNHLNIRFQEDFRLAKFILQHLRSVRDREHFSILFDMDMVFEKFISKLVYEEIGGKLQYTKRFGDFQLQPDIVLDNLIIDLKYKIFNRDVKQEDKYQMFAYGANFQRDTMIIYPEHLYRIDRKVRLGNIDLYLKSIDLDSELDYFGYIKEMKKRVRNILKEFIDE